MVGTDPGATSEASMDTVQCPAGLLRKWGRRSPLGEPASWVVAARSS